MVPKHNFFTVQKHVSILFHYLLFFEYKKGFKLKKKLKEKKKKKTESKKEKRKKEKERGEKKHTKMTPHTFFDSICFGSGGMGLFNYIGLLHVLNNANLLKDVKRIAGTSAGSIAGLIVCTRFLDHIKEKDDADGIYTMLRLGNEILSGIKSSTLQLSLDAENVGLLSKKEMYKLTSFILKHSGYEEDITIQEFVDQSGVEVSFIATDVYTSSTVSFDSVSFPNMMVKDAVRISCIVPLLSVPERMDDMLLVDGCFSSNIPYNHIPRQFWKTCLFTVVVGEYRNDVDMNPFDFMKAINLTTLTQTCIIAQDYLQDVVGKERIIRIPLHLCMSEIGKEGTETICERMLKEGILQGILFLNPDFLKRLLFLLSPTLKDLF